MPELPTNQELEELNQLVEMQLKLERRISELEAELKTDQERLKSVQETAIPELMSSIGITDFKLASGFRITIKADIYASILVSHVNDAVKWLDSKGLGDIVKDEVKVNFGRGEAERARDFMEWCELKGYNASEKLSVHPMTLKATVKEQLARGVEFPEEFFSIAPIRKAVIKLK